MMALMISEIDANRATLDNSANQKFNKLYDVKSEQVRHLWRQASSLCQNTCPPTLAGF